MAKPDWRTAQEVAARLMGEPLVWIHPETGQRYLFDGVIYVREDVYKEQRTNAKQTQEGREAPATQARGKAAASGTCSCRAHDR